MVKKQEQPPQEDRNPLAAFVEHQGKAVQELGRAALSLIPQGVRTHGWNALEESAKGFGALADVASDGINSVVKAVKKEIVPSKESEAKQE